MDNNQNKKNKNEEERHAQSPQNPITSQLSVNLKDRKSTRLNSSH